MIGYGKVSDGPAIDDEAEELDPAPVEALNF